MPQIQSNVYLRLALLVLLLSPLHLMEGKIPRPINIWEGKKGYKPVELYPYPAASPSAPAIIVCPGGSYFWHDMESEGHLVAQALQRLGFSAFVLRYRVAGVAAYVLRTRLLIRGNRYPDAQEDLQRAIALVKDQANTFHVDSTLVGAMGFSAGGHLVMSIAERYESARTRPHFVACIYPVVTLTASYTHKRSRRALLGEWGKRDRRLRDSVSLEHHVPRDCPPVFLLNALDDPVVDYRNAQLLDSALNAQRIPHRYIRYQTGGHGFGANPKKWNTETSQWLESFFSWFRETFPLHPITSL